MDATTLVEGQYARLHYDIRNDIHGTEISYDAVYDDVRLLLCSGRV